MKKYFKNLINPDTGKKDKILIIEYSFEDWENGNISSNWLPGRQWVYNTTDKKSHYDYLPIDDYRKILAACEKLYLSKVEHFFNGIRGSFERTYNKSGNRQRLIQIKIDEEEKFLFNSSLYEKLIVRGERIFTVTNSEKCQIGFGAGDYPNIIVEARSKFYEWLKELHEKDSNRLQPFKNLVKEPSKDFLPNELELLEKMVDEVNPWFDFEFVTVTSWIQNGEIVKTFENALEKGNTETVNDLYKQYHEPFYKEIKRVEQALYNHVATLITQHSEQKVKDYLLLVFKQIEFMQKNRLGQFIYIIKQIYMEKEANIIFINLCNLYSGYINLLNWLQKRLEDKYQYYWDLSDEGEHGFSSVQLTDQPLPVIAQTTTEERKKIADEYLNFFSGCFLEKKIMSDVDFKLMLEYVHILIETDKLPQKIKSIATKLPATHIRYTFYLIHKNIYGTKHIHDSWITFLHTVFKQFENPQESTTKKRFSEKPKSYDNDIVQK